MSRRHQRQRVEAFRDFASGHYVTSLMEIGRHRAMQAIYHSELDLEQGD